MNSKISKILNIVLDVLVVLVLLVSLSVVIISASSKKAGIANFAGITFLSVQTDSMEPTIMAGDMAFGKLTDGKTEFEIGDVVTFRQIIGRSIILNTHRVIEKEKINEIWYYTTRGDNTNGEDIGQIVAGDIVSKWTGKKISGLGKLLDFLKTGTGFVLCILLPVALFFVYYLISFIKNLSLYNKEKAMEAAAAKTDEIKEEIRAQMAREIDAVEKQKIIAEYLAQQEKAKGK